MLNLPKQTRGIKIIRHNYNLFKRLYNALIILLMIYVLSIFIDNKSEIYIYLLYSFSIVSLYMTGNIFFVLIKYLDTFDLCSDLNLWGMRFYGVMFWCIGIFMIFYLGFLLDSIFYITYIIIIFSLFILGGFCEFRSTRRYGIFIYRGN